MTAPEARASGPGMSRVDEGDDRQAAPGVFAQPPEQSPRVASGADQEDPPRGTLPICQGPDASRDIQCVVHELSPILGLGLLVRVTPRPVPGSTLTSGSSYRTSAFRIHAIVCFAQALRSTEPTINLSYSEDARGFEFSDDIRLGWRVNHWAHHRLANSRNRRASSLG